MLDAALPDAVQIALMQVLDGLAQAIGVLYVVPFVAVGMVPFVV